jgi:hypothetical protein
MMSKKIKKFDCIEMKRNIQDKIYNETKNMSREEYLAFIRKQVDDGPFGELLKQNNIKGQSLIAQR